MPLRGGAAVAPVSPCEEARSAVESETARRVCGPPTPSGHPPHKGDYPGLDRKVHAWQCPSTECEERP